MRVPATEEELAGLAVALGARSVRGWSAAEEALATQAVTPRADLAQEVRRRLRLGHDPLGDAFAALRKPESRRTQGATYTPLVAVRAMLAWAKSHGAPVRVVDPGAGSGRFIVNAGRRFPHASLVGVELDPLAALLARAALAAADLDDRAEVILADYREVLLPRVAGPTLFVGNPPYVRHHLLGQEWKSWLVKTAAARGLEASQLAGLHVHFFLATLDQARPGDFGAFITAAEWLDVNYGKLVRQLVLGDLGGSGINVIEPTALPFPDTATTAAITCFEVGARPRSLRLRRVSTLGELGALQGGRLVRRERLEAARRWTPLTRAGRKGPEGYVELGELCRVHRGQVTGANKVWIAGAHSAELPRSVLFPSVTRARELFAAGDVLDDTEPLRRVIDLPVDLDRFQGEERRRIDDFLQRAKAMGANRGYIAESRKAWWSVGLREAAPILATYMARRPPAFVLNDAKARHINIVHGIYPRELMSHETLVSLARYLAVRVNVADGRTYAGGLTKFEPKEMERLLVPGPELLGQSELLRQVEDAHMRDDVRCRVAPHDAGLKRPAGGGHFHPA